MKTLMRWVGIAGVLGWAVPLRSQVPPLLNYQGRVTANGTNFSGPGQFKFALVNGAGTLSFWSNDGTSNGGGAPNSPVTLPVSNGLFTVMLGDTNLAQMTVAIPLNTFTNPDVRLRLWFNDGVTGFQQLAPDQRLGSVGYAMQSASAALALGVAPGGVSNTMLQNSTVTVTAGAGLSGGGSVPLGGNTALAANLNRDATLLGNGGTSPLGLNLANPNTWTAAQTFSSLINGSISGTAAGFTGPLAGDVTGTQSATVITNLNASRIAGLFSLVC